MSGHQAKLKAQRTGAASVPILLACVCVLALALVFSACGGGSTTASSQLPTQLSPEQILAGVLAVVQGAGAAGSATGAASGEMVVQGEGDILLEPAGSAGPESFAGEVHVVRGPTTTFSLPARTSTTQSPTTLAPGQVAAWSGGTPGLYGGSRSKAKCDKELQLRFLEQNPAKAAAFCAALNSDPTLRWSGGNKVIPEQLRAYFAELTPMVLTRDTRVTNHGFRNGYPTPRQSVLQAGQGVLVDRYGVPRVRCECGNPLNPPQPVKTTPKYTGPKWTNFDPTTIIIIQQTTVIIDIFVVVDVDTGESFNRPAGSAGEKDTPHEVTTSTVTPTTVTSTTETPPTTSPPATAVPPSPEDLSYVGGFEGVWDTNWEVLTFTRNGTSLHGEYTYQNGRIEATLGADGRTMEGTWAEAPSYSPPDDGGTVVFSLSADGQAIDGQWWYGNDGSGGTWVGTRKK
jgi:hypothetical protein